MAVANKEKNYMFLHLYKCGGNSLRSMLHGEEILGVHCHAYDLMRHCFTQGLTEFWNSAYKFTFIRNPFDWQVSLYHYILRAESHIDHLFVKGHTLLEYLEFQRDVRMKITTHGANKYDTLTGFLTDKEGNMLVDHIYRYEDYDNEVKRLCDRIGEPFTEVPKLNVSQNRDRNYRKYYDAKTRELVEDMFGEDLRNFGYSF